MDAKQILTDVMSKRVDISKITEDTLLTSIGLDSLDLVEIMLEIEELGGFEFEDEKIGSVKTVKDVLLAIEEKL
jgi:acyl carrier protein